MRPFELVRGFFCGRNAMRSIAVFSLCFAAYFIVLESFLMVPAFNQDIQVRPASALGPVMGLFFSWPGIFGVACANLLSDVLRYDVSPQILAAYFAIQVAYNALPYVVWYLVHGRSKSPFPSIDSSFKLFTYLALALVDSIVVALLLVPVEPDALSAMNIHLAHALNNFIFLVYLGIPLAIAMDASRLVPIAPRAVRAAYRQRGKASLSQRLTVGFTVVAGVTVAIFAGISYSPFVVGFDSDFATVVASLYIQVSLLTMAAFVPLIVILAWIERDVTKSLDSLIDQSREFARQLSSRSASEDAAAREVLTPACFEGLTVGPEMRDLVDSVCLMREELEAYVGRLAAVMAERERTAAELDIARTIQMSAVPHDFTVSSVSHRVTIEGFMRPAREVGGDFYDVFDLSDGGIAFVIGDVSGKGVPAALFMMRAQSLFREKMLCCDDLGEVMTQVNDALCDRNEALLFVTAFACVLDPNTGRVRFANAGHNPPVLLQGGERSYMRIRPGLVLGAMEGMPYREGSFDLGMGDGLLLYTDGVTEAFDSESQLFGEGRLLDVLRKCDADAAVFTAKRIEAAVGAFAGECPQADDITVLSFRRNPSTLHARCIELPPETAQVSKLFGFLESLCEREGCTPKMTTSLMLVVEELFVNICSYGFPDGRPRDAVSVSAVMDDRLGQMTLELSDAGVPYNPLDYQPMKADASDEDRVGGLGILLVRHNVDDLDYEYLDGRNVLRLKKRYV